MVSALTNREWEAVRHLRQKYFFDCVPIEDPYIWTFKHPEHVHFLLYKSSQIIGYSHIQFWPNNRAALRIIVIDEPFRKKTFGSQFLKLNERWLSHQHIQVLHMQSTPEAYDFYCKNNYIEIAFNDPEGHPTHPRDIEIGKKLI